MGNCTQFRQRYTPIVSSMCSHKIPRPVKSHQHVFAETLLTILKKQLAAQKTLQMLIHVIYINQVEILSNWIK